MALSASPLGCARLSRLMSTARGRVVEDDKLVFRRGNIGLQQVGLKVAANHPHIFGMKFRDCKVK